MSTSNYRDTRTKGRRKGKKEGEQGRFLKCRSIIPPSLLPSLPPFLPPYPTDVLGIDDRYAGLGPKLNVDEGVRFLYQAGVEDLEVSGKKGGGREGGREGGRRWSTGASSSSSVMKMDGEK